MCSSLVSHSHDGSEFKVTVVSRHPSFDLASGFWGLVVSAHHHQVEEAAQHARPSLDWSDRVARKQRSTRRKWLCNSATQGSLTKLSLSRPRKAHTVWKLSTSCTCAKGMHAHGFHCSDGVSLTRHKPRQQNLDHSIHSCRHERSTNQTWK